MDVEAKSFKHAFYWKKKIIEDNYFFFQKKTSIELFESKIEFPDVQSIGFLIKHVLFIIPGSKYINNPMNQRPSWILAARSKTARDTARQTAKMDSARKIH